MRAQGRSVQVVDVPVPDPDPPGAVAESFAVADSIARHVREALARTRLAVVLSGSCHAGIGSVSGIAEGPRGIVWLDGHGDFNTPETSESGLLDGTTLASITGRCWTRLCASVAGFTPVPDENVILIGARSLDEGEQDLLEASGIAVISADEAPARVPAELRSLGQRVEGVYMHIDLDVLDPSVGMANAFATAGGLSEADLLGIVGSVLTACPVRVVGLASYDPSTDEEGAVCGVAMEIAGLVAEETHS